MAVLQDTEISGSTERAAMPPSHLFDILPALHEILSRIDHASSGPDPTEHDNTDLGTAYTNLQPLDPKELSTAILPLKAQIRRGQRELEKLPDMERSVAEQEEEIMELEGREAVLAGLGGQGNDT
ncbi:hypothetical protein LTR86_009480 [Recurvomyces mirabilis]|nr:hypothetical protein LTR86_009480 [Recurvomyces mirabilis]